jgi:hypothetical protein
VEAGGFKIQGQPGLQIKTLSQKNSINNNKKVKYFEESTKEVLTLFQKEQGKNLEEINKERKKIS